MFLNKYQNLKHIFFLLILIYPAFVFLLKSGIYWNMHDDLQMLRQFEMEKCIKDGQIPCRWNPDLGLGNGLPMFNFYPPLPYFIGQIFRTFNFSFVMSVKYTAVLQIILAALAMFLLAKTLFGLYGGLLSAIFYTYAPYHALNIYVRGAMNEAWASVFFPLIFLFSRKIINKYNKFDFLGLSLSFSFLLLSHNPMVLIFTPIVLLWISYWLIINFNNNLKSLFSRIFLIFSSLLLGFGLSAFFTLPSLFEVNLVKISEMFSGYYTYFNHYASIYQLFFSNYWGNGSSIWGPNDGMSFAIGYLHWLIPLFITVSLFIKFIRRRKIDCSDLTIFLIILLGLFITFLIHERSTFIWKLLPLLQKVQFPWRLLNVSNFLFSFSVGYIFVILKKYFKSSSIFIIFILLSLSVIFLNYKYFTPVISGPLTDNQKFSGLAWKIQTSSGMQDYLPKDVQLLPDSPADKIVSDIYPDNNPYLLSGVKKGTDWYYLNLQLDKQSKVILSVFYFPNFKVFVDGLPFNYQIDSLSGKLSLNLSPGYHQIFIKLSNTTIRNFSNLFSLLSFAILLFIIFNPKWKKLI